MATKLDSTLFESDLDLTFKPDPIAFNLAVKPDLTPFISDLDPASKTEPIAIDLATKSDLIVFCIKNRKYNIYNNIF
jgi:hypothetical protein